MRTNHPHKQEQQEHFIIFKTNCSAFNKIKEIKMEPVKKHKKHKKHKSERKHKYDGKNQKKSRTKKIIFCFLIF